METLKHDFVAKGAAIPYAGAVTDAEFWQAIGVELRRRREQRGYTSTYAFYKANRSVPVTNTLDVIEEGRPGRVDNLERYCAALGVTTADLFRTVLDAADGLGPSLTDADWSALQLLREIPASEERDAWLLLGRRLAVQLADDLDP